jgi:hypothetical protein
MVDHAGKAVARPIRDAAAVARNRAGRTPAYHSAMTAALLPAAAQLTRIQILTASIESAVDASDDQRQIDSVQLLLDVARQLLERADDLAAHRGGYLDADQQTVVRSMVNW